MTHYVSALHDDIFVGGEKMSAIGIKKRMLCICERL